MEIQTQTYPGIWDTAGGKEECGFVDFVVELIISSSGWLVVGVVLTTAYGQGVNHKNHPPSQ